MDYIEQLGVILDSHRTFYFIAHEHYQKVIKLVDNREQYIAEHGESATMDNEETQVLCRKNDAIERAAMISVIFSALTLERVS
jgi:rhamnose utilization protein RhaD (predicted bifunctional aldolase and dehydrogenase)